MASKAWAPGEPNNFMGRQEDCMILLKQGGGKWFDAPCNWGAPYFLCQKGKKNIMAF